ncbi:tRNA uridine-5-carboxymethylaminomethyl(34) synthesis GTPase MnmE [Pseudohoeflea coraliihabitans]|uniref:tRNA modification GTPase MnmE n=1 Tax=Pseudohoeflea coraliihabitans TaxID=2860393 RepID=A0ABS6WT54_9HYPH|nr:tRNA uridine-5-carboxymethylaminomethyl(34) synthesis GTPase MnmE [Pseudohoeflea sp. DP4N28-3]
MSETIFALSSGRPPAGLAVLRVSGPRTRFVIETIYGSLPKPRRATLGSFRDMDGGLLDRGLLLFFPGPNSFTGEDCCEFHLHGGQAVVHRFLEVLSGIEGSRSASAGEFTRRAFGNGKLDLTEVEGLADLLAAETEMQRQAALEQAGGEFRKQCQAWMAQLTRARASIEAELDFADEEDIPGSVSDRIWPELFSLRQELNTFLTGTQWGEIVRDGFKVAIMGPPNAGKSTLLNALAARDVAIVSQEPGTTRDLIEVRLSLGGFLVLLTDTAGLRDAADPIEAEGVRRSRIAAEAADLVLLVSDENETPSGSIQGLEALAPAKILRVRNKCDLLPAEVGRDQYDAYISARSGEGLDRLVDRILDEVRKQMPKGAFAGANRVRHKELLQTAVSRIDAALEAKANGPEIVGFELREAARAIGQITGQVGVEALLGAIFSEFCVGK